MIARASSHRSTGDSLQSNLTRQTDSEHFCSRKYVYFADLLVKCEAMAPIVATCSFASHNQNEFAKEAGFCVEMVEKRSVSLALQPRGWLTTVAMHRYYSLGVNKLAQALLTLARFRVY